MFTMLSTIITYRYRRSREYNATPVDSIGKLGKPKWRSTIRLRLSAAWQKASQYEKPHTKSPEALGGRFYVEFVIYETSILEPMLLGRISRVVVGQSILH